MARRRQSGFKELMGVAARLPWWLGVILALVVYLALHHIATMEIAKPQGLKALGAFEGQTLFKTLATFGQYIFSLAFLAGAGISAATSLRRAAANTGTTREVATVSTRVEPKLTGLGLNLDNHPSKRDSSSLKPQVWSLDLLSTIEWKRFEDLAAEYYREKGIRCETTSLGADGGIDLKLFQDDSGKPTAIVQCKAWVGRMVGVKPVRELRGVMAGEQVEKGFFMTSSTYSDDAKEFARKNQITLIDATLFLMMIKRLPQESQQRLLRFATQGDYMTPTCPTCGVKMVKRNGGRGAFWGCGNYPRCKQILNIGRQASS
jgi:restriction system protein